MRYLKIWLLLLLAVGNKAHAFESWEHRQLALLAYVMAVDIYCRDYKKKPDEAFCAQPHLLPRWDSANNDWHRSGTITYGDIAMCVDFFLSPDKLIAGRETSLIGDEVDPTKRAKRSLFPANDKELDLDHAYRCRDKLLNYEGMRAMHVNHTHFQAELLVAQRHNHMLALSLKTVEQNLYSALLLNAVSDHFLHDSFAPGHITSWRNRLTDLAANAYHDKHNREGWIVDIDAKALKEFLLMKNKAGKETPLAALVFAQMMGEHDAEQGRQFRQAFFVPQREDGDVPCGGECRSVADGEPRRILGGLADTFGGENYGKIPVTLRGDSFLWSRQHDEQRFLMLLVEMRSILDILQSSSERLEDPDGGVRTHVVDSFKGSAWDWRYNWKSKPDTWLTTRDSTIEMEIGPVSYKMPHSSEPAPQSSTTPRSINYRDMDAIVGVSLGADNMVFGDAQTRYNATFEAVVFGLAKAERNRNWGLTVGLQPYTSRDFSGVSLMSRIVFMRPEIEMAGSIPFRMIRIKQVNGKSSWRPSIGFRVDAGFTSFLTFYMQANWDVAAQRDGRLRYGPSLGAGLQLAAPKCRVPLLKSVADCGISSSPVTIPGP